ncbi:MAG: carbohydrate ABC transporter permease [Defluviitaleaceae bacterium]|nr:carbohydrate ABC transporter permease [Defluviitaleaceae bacterium]
MEMVGMRVDKPKKPNDYNKRRFRLFGSDLSFDIINTFFLILIFAVVTYPLYYIIIASFSAPELVLNGQVTIFPRGFQLGSYERVFNNPDVLRGYWNTIQYTTVGTIVNMLVTIPAAYAMSRSDLKGRGIFMLFFAFTMFFGGGMIPTFLVVQRLGLLDTFWAMIFPGAMSVWNLIICRNFFQNNIPKELLECSQMDGCTNRRFFMQIVLPLSKAILAVMVLFYAVGHWNSFFNALIYLRDDARMPLQMVLRRLLVLAQPDPNLGAEMMEDWVRMLMEVEMLKYALVVVASVPILILYPIVQKHFAQGVMIGSIKG